MDVADASSQEVNAQSGDLGALFGVSDFAVADYAVLNAADGTNFGFDGQALVVCQLNQLTGFGNVLFDGVVGAIEHDGGKASFNAGLCALIGAVVQVQGNGNRDAERFIHCAHHGGNGLETGHIFAGTLGNTQDNRALHGLSLKQNAPGPFQVIDIELANTIVAVTSFEEHIGCIYEHNRYLL